MIREETPEQWTNNTRAAICRSHDTNIRRAPSRRANERNNGESPPTNTCAPGSCERPPNNKRRAIPCNRADQTAHFKNEYGKQECRFQREISVSFPPCRLEGRVREEEGAAVPAYLIEAVEFVGYPRDGCRDYGHVEGGEEDADNQGDENEN